VGRRHPRGRLLRRQGRPGSAVRAAWPCASPRPSIRPCIRAAALRSKLDGKRVGFIGELHPRWLQKYDLPQAPVLFEVDAAALCARVVPSYTEISKFPGATRDLALVVKQDVPAQALIDAFHAELASNELGKIVQAVVLFDEYRGKGLEQDEKSLLSALACKILNRRCRTMRRGRHDCLATAAQRTRRETRA
jgi:phenylalanyl-tRNA synthetase beta subunit